MRFSLAKLLAVVSVLAALIAVIVAYRSYFQSHRVGVSASVANRMMWPEYELPHTATDVTYYADFRGCEAEFAISESEFLNWCSVRGWSPKKIAGAIPYFQPVLLADNDTIVTNGFTFDMPNGEGIFDADRLRTAFWVSTFP